MKHCTTQIIQFCLLLLLCLSTMPAWANPQCFNCHEQGPFKGQITHNPVAKGQCTQCHNPHLAKHQGLLTKKGSKLCFQCHQSFESNLQGYLYHHQPVMTGECTACHDPHSSTENNLLNQDMAKLCLSCHDSIRDQAGKAHAPFAKGQCNQCHLPHGGNNKNLLKKNATKICLSCHTQSSSLRQKHLNRDLTQIDCLECHQPHKSTQTNLLREKQHEPFSDGDCQQCHSRNNDMTLCLECHDGILSSFNGQFSHLVNGSQPTSCFNCHSPHTSRQDGLIKQQPGEACRQCHAGKFVRRNQNLYVHPDAENCVMCHQLHSSDQPAMRKGESDKACIACHEKHSSFSHPLGENAIDHRNGKPMDCISCHDPCNGTMYKYNLRGTSDKGLCIKCHAGY